MKTTYSLLTALLLSLQLMAQDDMPGMPEHNRQIESYRIAFITDKLNLTPKEATAFWPIYNEYNEQIKALRQKDRERTRVIREKAAPTDKEADAYIQEHFTFRQSELDLTKKYISEFRKVLPTHKVARLVTLEPEFKMQLLRRIHDRRD